MKLVASFTPHNPLTSVLSNQPHYPAGCRVFLAANFRATEHLKHGVYYRVLKSRTRLLPYGASNDVELGLPDGSSIVLENVSGLVRDR